uniref:SUN domain-containing protein n=1 Tax=Strongyloides papillosus TaxID=174720 RepID=A0A0N5CI56_STREA
MSSSTTSSLKSFSTSKNGVAISSNNSTKKKDDVKSCSKQPSETNDKESSIKSLFKNKKDNAAKKNVSFSKDTDFTTNHSLVKLNPKTGEYVPAEKDKYSITKKQIKKREQLKARTTLKDGIKIFIYYVFLISLYFFFAWVVFCIFKPRENNRPHIHGESSFHGYEPQLIATPMEKDPAGKNYLVRFDSSDPSTYQIYLEKIKKFLTNYEDKSHGRRCSFGDTNKDIHETSIKEKRFCLNEEKYNDVLPDCTDEHDYGFKYGNPCFILSLNNHLNWVPGKLDETYKEENNLHDFDTTHYIPITCTGGSNTINATYSNKNGINKKYYPFFNIQGFHKGYQMIQFYDVQPNTEYRITCIAHTGNDHKKFDKKKNQVVIKIIKNQ